jgi:hypothetical protein
VGENIYYLYIRQETDNQNIQGAQKTELLKYNNSMKKWAKELNRTFQRKKSKWPKHT